VLGRAPSAGESLVALRAGAWGEFVVVILANLAAGTLLASAVRLVRRLVGWGLDPLPGRRRPKSAVRAAFT